MENNTLKIQETKLKVQEKQTSAVSEVHTDYFFYVTCHYSIPFMPMPDFTYVFKIFKKLISGKKNVIHL